MTVRRTTTLAMVIGGVVVAAGAGWLAGSRVKSPEQVAAEAEPPSPSRITVPVEMRTLSSEIIVRGDVGFDEPETIVLSDPPGFIGGASIVTLIPNVGDEIAEGARALEVSGRPILVLEGELPMFRTLRRGDEGEDVLQLEKALKRLGFDITSPNDTYATETEEAVAAWYRSLGYDPGGPSELELAAVDAAKLAVAEAQEAVTAAEQALADAKRPVPYSQRLELDAAVRRAESNLADQQEAAAAAEAAAGAEVTSAVDVLADAEAALALAEERLAAAIGGVHPDTGLPPTHPQLAALRQAVDDATAEVEAAEANLVTAEAGLAEAEQQGARAIADAEHDLAVAKALRSEALATPSTTFEQRMVNDAKARLATAKSELADAEALTGVTAPRAEILFLDSLPLRVEQVFVERGDVVAGQVLQVTGHRLAIDSAVDVADVERVEVGASVRIEETWMDLDTTGVIVDKAARPGTHGLDPGRVHIEIEADDDLSEFSGANVKITIPLETTGGDVLAVPIAALSAAADGSARVEVEHEDGTTELCAVTTGLTSGGYVEVIPLDGALAAGDRVVVGREYGLAS